MKLKIRNTEVISVRVPGELYYEIMKRAEVKKLSITDYVKNAIVKYMEYKEKEVKE